MAHDLKIMVNYQTCYTFGLDIDCRLDEIMMPDLKSFDLDMTQWIDVDQDPNQRTWRNASVVTDVLVQGITLSPPTDLPKTYPDIRELTLFYNHITSRQGGQLIEVTLRAIDGVEAIKMISTSPIPYEPKVTRYVGAWIFPLQDFFCSIHFQCHDTQPSHPLTRIHRYLYELPLSIRLGSDVKRAKPYRP